jgi:hypothetical protein
MVTIAIIGLGLTIVFLQIDTFLPASRLQAACRILVSDLENLRLAAIVTFKVPVHLEYDLENHGYRAYIPYEYEDDGITRIGPGETEILEFRPLPESIIFESIAMGLSKDMHDPGKLITIIINPDGSLTGHISHIMDEHYGREYSVRVASLTGFAEILDQRVEYEEFNEGF